MFKGMREDIATIKEKDPAATSTLNVVLNSTGMQAVWRHRVEHTLWNKGKKGLSRYLATRSRHRTGVEIHPGATIGRRFVIDHGMGVVIGETTVIGDDCMIYQGVTLGGTGKEWGKRHPTLGNNVLVGVGASVLGNITLADGAKVGGGAVVVKDVAPGCTVVGIPGHVVVPGGGRPSKTGEVPCAEDVKRLEKQIDEVEDRLHRAYLPDPMADQIDILTEKVTAIEETLDQLTELIARLADINENDK